MTMVKINIKPELINLAKELRLLYPSGIKPGTNTPWRSSSIEIAKRLQDVEKIFQIELNPELVKSTITQYVQSFGENQQFMRVLKYFILKYENGPVSDLITYMEMVEDGQIIQNNNNDWITNLK